MAINPLIPIAITTFLFLLSFITGALLSNFIKPRNVLLLNIHKFVSLLTAISTAITIYGLASHL